MNVSKFIRKHSTAVAPDAATLTRQNNGEEQYWIQDGKTGRRKTTGPSGVGSERSQGSGPHCFPPLIVIPTRGQDAPEP